MSVALLQRKFIRKKSFLLEDHALERIELIKKILVAHDGSENADKALEVGLDLADRYSAEVIILSVSSSVSKFTPWISFPSVSQSTLNAYLKEIEENQQKMLFSALKKAKETKPKIRTSTKLVIGKPADMIVKTAKEDEFDLIVVGSRGLSGVNEFLLGSVSDRVADKATCPVLIVK